MKLCLTNIGKIKAAEVEIKGITVIAGENDTGKSTFGRALFAVFNSFYRMDEKIQEERIENIERLIDNFYRKNVYVYTRKDFTYREEIPNTNEIAKVIVKEAEKYRDAPVDQFKNLFHQYHGVFNENQISQIENATSFTEMIQRIREALSITDAKIREMIVRKALDSEFNGQVCNVFSNENGEIKLTIQGKSIVVHLFDDSVEHIDGSINLHTEAVYIDDPFVVDGIRPAPFAYRRGYVEHRTSLMKKLLFPQGKSNIVNEIITNNKFEHVYEKISLVCGGEIMYNHVLALGYRQKGSEKVIDVRNLSTGMKTFVILKMLLVNGVIEQNGTIILDEPEIHLHPEWQVLFAELIVLLQKEFGLHILLNTHSPYFLEAIQVYSEKHGVADRCKYYLSQLDDGEQATVQDVSDHVEKIYEKLAAPFQKLEDERWENG